MLKYNLRDTNLLTQLREIELDSYELLELYSSDTYQSLLVCYLPDDIDYKLSEGMAVYVRSTIVVDNNNGLTKTDNNFSKSMKIRAVNNEKGLFTLKVDKYYDLHIDNLTELTEGDNVVWYFHFDENHLFFDGQDNMVYYDENGDVITDSNNETSTIYGSTIIYIDYTNANGDIVTLAVNCEYENTQTLKVLYTEELLGDFRDSIYSESLDGFLVTDVEVYRENPYWGNSADLHIFIDEPICSLQVPIMQKFETDTFVGIGVQEEFVDATIEESINSIVEMEKDVYVPVMWDSNTNAVYQNGNEINGEVYEIQFNLHFRQHRGDDWLAAVDSYWNGVINDNGTLKLIEYNEGDDDTDSSGYNFFTLSDRNSQSDLLTYLGFDNDDVKYQKSKVKMSFLRLLFYDSMNPGNQNLLHYATIFMDSGKLFKKYIKGVEDTPYTTIDYDTDEDGNELDTFQYENCRFDRIGIKVDREPFGILLEEAETDDDIDELRLSSRFVVEDKYDAEKSSEGFYLYLWKDNDNGFAPTDIYMKVEFNHAGYGRTIPFMMPFYDEKVDGKTGIKTFEEILDDWSYEPNSGEIKGYGVRKYLKYSYIHLKYRYDKVNERHVYYLDDTVYGDSAFFDNNRLVFNLYEAKMV